MGVLRMVMRECRNNNDEVHFLANQSEILEDENSPNYDLSVVEMHVVLNYANVL